MSKMVNFQKVVYKRQVLRVRTRLAWGELVKNSGNLAFVDNFLKIGM